jgi:hypothetical protein
MDVGVQNKEKICYTNENRCARFPGRFTCISDEEFTAIASFEAKLDHVRVL